MNLINLITQWYKKSKIVVKYFLQKNQADSEDALLKLGLKKLNGPGRLISDDLLNIKNTPPTRPITSPTIKNPMMKPATEPSILILLLVWFIYFCSCKKHSPPEYPLIFPLS